MAWFRANARDLPWRKNRSPYRIWVSEIMLQQTRVDTVVPYYERFLKRFPTVRALAAAPLDDVLKLWEGLGYYSRARNLHAAARKIVDEHGGRFPKDLESIRALPGIGPYTGAAIASLAFGIRAAAVDGNVLRVLSRLTAFEKNIAEPAARAEIQRLADRLIPEEDPGAFNEALMELGATVCTPRNPQCGRCPWSGDCRARRTGDPTSFPRKSRSRVIPHKRVGAGVVARKDGTVLIAQRKPDSMLGGLWEFPGGTQENGESIEACIARELKEELGIDVAVGPHLITVRHAFSHFRMELHAHLCRLRSGRPRAIHCADWRWVSLDEIGQFAFGRADQKIIDYLRRNRNLIRART